MPDTEHGPPRDPDFEMHKEIAMRAYQIWLQQGRPAGRAEEHWLEAERQLQDAAVSRKLTEINEEKAGSVQS